MNEAWHPIAGTGGRYEVSSKGSVRRSDGLMLKVSRPRTKREYPAVMLRCGSSRRRVAVHRLVAEAFVAPFGGEQVRHIDGNHMNASADNLKWGTALENAADRARHGTTASGSRHGLYGKGHKGSKNGASKLTEENVREIRRLGGEKTQRELAEMFGVHQGVIWRVLKRLAWKHVSDTAAALRAKESE